VGSQRANAELAFRDFVDSLRTAGEEIWAAVSRCSLSGETVGVVATNQRLLLIDYTFVKTGRWKRDIIPRLRSEHSPDRVTVERCERIGAQYTHTRLTLRIDGAPLVFEWGGWKGSGAYELEDIAAAFGGYRARDGLDRWLHHAIVEPRRQGHHRPSAASEPLGEPGPSGWYPDPSGRYRERFWDGKEWTWRVRDEPGGKTFEDPPNAHRTA
jgi:hypothetical protein